MQEPSAMTMQLAASLERMTHTWRIIYYRVGGHLHLKAGENTAVSHYLVFWISGLPIQGILQNLIMILKHLKKKLKLPFSASGARTSKIISFFSCSVCFWKSRTSSSAILVEANCSLLDSEKTEEYHRHVIKENNSSLPHTTSYVQSIEIIITFFACVKVFLDLAWGNCESCFIFKINWNLFLQSELVPLA